MEWGGLNGERPAVSESGDSATAGLSIAEKPFNDVYNLFVVPTIEKTVIFLVN